MLVDEKDHRTVLLNPVFSMTKGYLILVIVSLTLIVAGFNAWVYQLLFGLGVTGLNQRVFWGIYISNFIFFIGISYSGTLISAVLRILNAEWRTPLTRMAEQITVIGIIVGFAMVLIDMGRPDRLFFVPYATRLQSPLFWDMLSVTSYLMGSLIFFYLPLIPDLAILRDHVSEMEGYGFRKKFYRILSLGYKGTEKQKHSLEKAMNYMSIILIPIAIMCHTVIAFIFAMTWRVGWHSTIFGPYFVVAAIFSGTGGIIMVMTILRKVYKLEEYITYEHYKNMAYILFLLLATYFYFTLTEYFTTIYRGAIHDIELLFELFFGAYAWYFWFFIVLGMITPAILLLTAARNCNSEKSVAAIFVASVLVVVGMWVKRFIIIVPALARPFVSEDWTVYKPTVIEWVITLAGVSAFILAFAVFTKLFPVISIWEIEEEAEAEREAAIAD